MDINQFGNYAMHVPRPQNTESGELELKKIGGKWKYKIKFILHHYLKKTKWNQITNKIKGSDPPLMG